MPERGRADQGMPEQERADQGMPVSRQYIAHGLHYPPRVCVLYIDVASLAWTYSRAK